MATSVGGLPLDTAGARTGRSAAMGEIGNRLVGRLAVGLTGALLVTAGGAPAAHAAAAEPLLGDTTVEGGSRLQAATVLTPGLYLTERVEEDTFFRVDRTVPGSTLWVSVAVVEERLSTGYFRPTMLAEGAHGSECSTYDRAVLGDEAGTYRSGTMSTAGGAQEDVVSQDDLAACAEAEYVTVKLPAPTDDDQVAPGTPLQLLVWEEAPVTDAADLPPVSPPDWEGPTASDERTSVTAGTSPTDAPLLEDGSYVVDVRPAGANLLAIRLDWGQHAEVAARTVQRGGSGETASVIWHMPLGSYFSSDTAEGPYPENEPLQLGSRRPSEWMSPTVAYRDRETARHGPAAVPGIYLVDIRTAVLSAEPGMALEIDVQAAGEVEGAPTYDAAGADLPPLPERTRAGAEEQGDGGDGSGDEAAGDAGSSRPWPAILGLFAGAGAFTVAGVVSWGRARPSGRAR